MVIFSGCLVKNMETVLLDMLEGPQCIVQCKICPEHRIRSKNYVVCLTVDEANESIVSVECKDCAAAAGN